MSQIQNGVLEKSKMFFSPPAQNKGLLFYPLSTGHFYCDSAYKVERDNFDSILVNYIVRGTFSFLIDGREHTAHSGDIVLIDCFDKHTYYTNNGFESYWVHINGSNTYDFFGEITSRFSNIITANDKIEADIKDIYTPIKNKQQISESEMSFKIYRLFCDMLNLYDGGGENNIITASIDYIANHYSESLTVDKIAKIVHLSSSQFSRRFKKQTGTSPYDYILSVRLTKAKELLKNTSLPISEIAYRTGFASDSNFIYFFKKQEGISPLKFRNILF